jgi:beta-1,4-N-acetylglucosaminyltransferase
MVLLIVLGGGGHTTEILKLVDLLGPDYEYHYLLVKEVAFSRERLKLAGQVHEVRRPRGMYDNIFATVVNSLTALVQITVVVFRARPAAVIGCGPAISVLASIVGKIRGAKVIYIETGSRVKTLSLTGRIMRRIADLYFIQWPSLKEEHPKAIYAGRL